MLIKNKMYFLDTENPHKRSFGVLKGQDSNFVYFYSLHYSDDDDNIIGMDTFKVNGRRSGLIIDPRNLCAVSYKKITMLGIITEYKEGEIYLARKGDVKANEDVPFRKALQLNEEFNNVS